MKGPGGRVAQLFVAVGSARPVHGSTFYGMNRRDLWSGIPDEPPPPLSREERHELQENLLLFCYGRPGDETDPYEDDWCPKYSRPQLRQR